jgi:hypothetical protein
MLDDILTGIRTLGGFALLYFTPGIICGAMFLCDVGEDKEPEKHSFPVCSRDGEHVEFTNVHDSNPFSWAKGMLKTAHFNGEPVLLYFTGNPPNYNDYLVEVRVDDTIIFDCNK